MINKLLNFLSKTLPIITLIFAIVLFAFALLVAVRALSLGASPSLNPTPSAGAIITTATPYLKFWFDANAKGWTTQNYPGNQAVVSVQTSPEHIKFGQSSLELQVELVGGDEQKSKGEAYVDLLSSPPPGLTAPLDLENKLITFWVYVPATVVGDPNAPNGLQVFVKDVADNSEYGEWLDLTNSNSERWITVTITPSRKITSRLSVMDVGFDPSKIIILGLKIGAGASSKATFRGSIWIAGVSW